MQPATAQTVGGEWTQEARGPRVIIFILMGDGKCPPVATCNVFQASVVDLRLSVNVPSGRKFGHSDWARHAAVRLNDACENQFLYRPMCACFQTS